MHLSGRRPSLSTRPWTERQRIVLLSLIGTNLAVFVAQLFLDMYQPGFVRSYLALSDRGIHEAYAWEFVTAMFLHYGPWHLLGNMLVLYFLGRDLESILGRRHFLYLYLAGAIGGELGHLFLMPPDTILFAASGGVAALLVAYATILPELELTALTFLMVPLRLKAKYLACGVIALAVVLLCIDRNGAVSHSAYLGGGAAGWLYAHLLGFGHPSFFQRALRQRSATAERFRQMTAEQFIAQEIDPLLEKISRTGMESLTRTERRILDKAREKVLEKAPPA
jgi:membrane associated rhomboid family serine protease